MWTMEQSVILQTLRRVKGQVIQISSQFEIMDSITNK